MAAFKWTQESQIRGTNFERTLSQHKHNGISCNWKSLSEVSKSGTSKNVYFAWQFDWDELKKQGVGKLDGTITVSCYKSPNSRSDLPPPNVSGFPKIITVHLTRSGQWVDLCIGSESDFGKLFRGDFFFKCVFEMKPTKNRDGLNIFEKTFAASDKTDAILVVEGKKLHVNKQFLSFHSDYFNTLFSSEFKEKSMVEIPIEDVKYDDFARLLSVIYPNPINPNVDTYETLLKLADRFMMPHVTHQVELFLIGNENVRISKKIALADKYSMNELLKACLNSIETPEEMKRIAETSDFEQLSHEMKAELFHKTLTLS